MSRATDSGASSAATNRHGSEVNAKLRRAAFDKTDCTNGPDEYGNWPCDPAWIFGSDEAECQVCGRVARMAVNRV